jgi:hypothetical protein
LVIAPLWVAYQANLGTLLRTCDATGACIAVPDTPHYRQALTVGDSRGLARRCCIHWINTGKDRWIRLQRRRAFAISKPPPRVPRRQRVISPATWRTPDSVVKGIARHDAFRPVLPPQFEGGPSSVGMTKQLSGTPVVRHLLTPEPEV